MNGKKFLLVLTLCVVISGIAWAGSYEETLHGISMLESGGYGGAVAKYSQVAGEFATFTGARGAWVINHRFSLGAGFYRLSSNIDETMTPDNARKLGGVDLRYNGIELEYIMKGESVVHLVGYTLIGAGRVSFSRYDAVDDNIKLVKDDLLVIEPAVNLQVNMTDWCRVDLGLGYRMMMGVEDKSGNYMSSDNLGGMSATLVIKFGVF